VAVTRLVGPEHLQEQLPAVHGQVVVVVVAAVA